jgi:hypothetical protein
VGGKVHPNKYNGECAIRGNGVDELINVNINMARDENSNEEEKKYNILQDSITKCSCN